MVKCLGMSYGDQTWWNAFSGVEGHSRSSEVILRNVAQGPNLVCDMRFGCPKISRSFQGQTVKNIVQGSNVVGGMR